MDDLIRQLHHIEHARNQSYRQCEPDLQIYAGLEDAKPSYDWDGLKRSADPAHPFLVFQYTLDGWGMLEDGDGRHPVRAGSAFTAIIPSEHRYYRPSTSTRWLVLWLVVNHPYIVQRFAKRQREYGARFSLDPGHPLLLRVIDLFKAHCSTMAFDMLTHEQHLFDMLWEYERLIHRNRYTSEHERLVDAVRQHIIDTLDRPVSVAELAGHQGMSRSHFSHYFRAAVGISPAQYVQQVRLDIAAQRLLHTTDTVDQIARETGFATAAHFCRVFRRRFHLSPGEFRRQMR